MFKFKVIFIVLLFTVFLAGGCCAQGNIGSAQNPGEKSQYAWDFGSVKEGQILKHEFALKNESSKILNIKDVNSSCGCMVSQVKKKALLPGESTLVEVKFNTKGYSGPTEQFVYVHTDSLNQPILRFTVKANVK